MTKDEYLALVTKFVDEQYGKEIDPIEDHPTFDTIKHGKDRIVLNSNTVINATNFKKEEIKDAILRAANLRVDNFLIKVIKHNYNSEDENGIPVSYNLSIFEESPYVYLNRPSKKITKIVPSKDSRMDTRPWAQYFGTSDQASYMTLDSFLDMIRWLQAMSKLGAFL